LSSTNTLDSFVVRSTRALLIITPLDFILFGFHTVWLLYCLTLYLV